MKETLPAWLPLTAAVALLVSGCAVEVARPSLPHLVVTPWPVVYAPTAQAAVVSVYIDPPLFQPQPIAITWAPPPMLVDVPLPMPFVGAIWTGGYWAWQGNWVWAAGRWAAPPQLGFGWVQPYYEHRDSVVIFIGGHWAAPGVVFVAPPSTLNIVVINAEPGVLPGPRPIGPAGVFVPAPPGSRPGIIVPAPVGTARAVMMSAPPVTNVGMQVRTTVNNTTFNDTRITNITNINNIPNNSNSTSVSVVAPAEAMVSGHAYQATMPALAHLAAALPPVLHVAAPVPVSTRPMAAFVPGQAPAALPPTQAVRNLAGTAAAPPATPARAQPVAAVAPSPVAAKVPERPSEPTPSAAAHPPKPVQPAVHDDAKADQQRQMLAAAKASTQRAEAEKTAHQLANAKAEAEQAARLRKTREDAERRERGER